MNKPNKPTYEELKIELAEARAYADKLAAGLPDGMLPKDVENLREANLALANELAIMTEDRDSETRWAKEYFDNWQSVNKQPETVTAEKNIAFTAAAARHNALRKMGYTGEPIMLLEDVKKLIVSK